MTNSETLKVLEAEESITTAIKNLDAVLAGIFLGRTVELSIGRTKKRHTVAGIDAGRLVLDTGMVRNYNKVEIVT